MRRTTFRLMLLTLVLASITIAPVKANVIANGESHIALEKQGDVWINMLVIGLKTAAFWY